MKFFKTEFAHQLFAAVAGTLFLVAGIAFTTLPAIQADAGTTFTWHLT